MTMVSQLSFGALVAGSLAVPAGAVTTVTLNIGNGGGGITNINIGANSYDQYVFISNSEPFKNIANFQANIYNSFYGSLAPDTGAPVPLPALGTATNNGTLTIGDSKNVSTNRYLSLEFPLNGVTQVGNAFFDAGHGLTRIEYAAAGAVPEPAVWAELVAGFALAGAALRRRRSQAASAA